MGDTYGTHLAVSVPLLFAEAEASMDKEDRLTGSLFGYIQFRRRHIAMLIAVSMRLATNHVIGLPLDSRRP
jgi:hypothetical protein